MVSCAGLPHKAAWQLMGRILRFMVRSSGPSFEVFDLKSAHDQLQDAQNALETNSCNVCVCCRSALVPHVTIVVKDVDQAFEACTATSISPALSLYVQRFLRSNEDSAGFAVTKGRKGIVRSSSGPFRASEQFVSISDLCRAVLGFCHLTLVAIGNTFFEISGLPIGAVLSSSCVSMFLGACEILWYRDVRAQRSAGFHFHGVHSSKARHHIQLLRYVDDVAGLSKTCCPMCVSRWVDHVYPLTMSTVAGPSKPGSVCMWADIELRPVQFAVRIVPCAGWPRTACAMVPA